MCCTKPERRHLHYICTVERCGFTYCRHLHDWELDRQCVCVRLKWMVHLSRCGLYSALPCGTLQCQRTDRDGRAAWEWKALCVCVSMCVGVCACHQVLVWGFVHYKALNVCLLIQPCFCSNKMNWDKHTHTQIWLLVWCQLPTQLNVICKFKWQFVDTVTMNPYRWVVNKRKPLFLKTYIDPART